MSMGRKAIICLGGVLLAALCLGAAGAVCWNRMIHRPFRLERDCRGLGIDVETIKRWEKREENGSLEVVKIGGWRIGGQEMVSSVSTGRKQPAGIISVYGSMELVREANILDGRYGLDEEGNFCVLSEELANHLFGSVHVAGECIRIERERFLVAGVIEAEEDFVMIPMKEGTVETLAVVFRGAMEAEERMSRLLSE